MQILVTAINPTRQTRLGCMQLTAFLAEFEGAEFSGTAWFIPASGNANDYVGQTLEVELSQEGVTQVSLTDEENFEARIQYISAPCTYQVRGIVNCVIPLEVPIGECIVYISSGNANFTLTATELGGLKPEQGVHLSFTVHELSLWDEAI